MPWEFLIQAQACFLVFGLYVCFLDTPVACGIFVPRVGIERMSLTSEGRSLTTRKSQGGSVLILSTSLFRVLWPFLSTQMKNKLTLFP